MILPEPPAQRTNELVLGDKISTGFFGDVYGLRDHPEFVLKKMKNLPTQAGLAMWQLRDIDQSILHSHSLLLPINYDPTTVQWDFIYYRVHGFTLIDEINLERENSESATETAVSYVRQLCTGMLFIHDNGVVHGDLINPRRRPNVCVGNIGVNKEQLFLFDWDYSELLRYRWQPDIARKIDRSDAAKVLSSFISNNNDALDLVTRSDLQSSLKQFVNEGIIDL